jgi:hypothetical protein
MPKTKIIYSKRGAMQMQKSTAQGNFTPATMLNARKRIGSTVYVKNVYLKEDAVESMQDKILRLVKNDCESTKKTKNGLNCSQKNDIMEVLQTERLPERSSV